MSMFNRNEKETGTGAAVGDKPGDAPASVAAAPKPAQPVIQPVVQPAPEPAAVRSGNAGPSVISKALKITGQLESTEDIRIDGEVNGDVRAVSVTVGNNAKVKGNVYGDTVELAGTVEGKIEAKKVVLGGTARMTGDVVHQDIRIESGAFIDGRLKPEFGKTTSKTNGAGHA